MNKFKEKLRLFMIGRYGMDQLGQFLTYLVLVAAVINLFLRRGFVARFLEMVMFAGIVIFYMRFLSRNIGKRYKENEAFLRLRFYVQEYVKKLRFGATEKSPYRIFKCPNCKQKVRVPRGRGRISIHCPKCGKDFIRRS